MGWPESRRSRDLYSCTPSEVVPTPTSTLGLVWEQAQPPAARGARVLTAGRQRELRARLRVKTG